MNSVGALSDTAIKSEKVKERDRQEENGRERASTRDSASSEYNRMPKQAYFEAVIQSEVKPFTSLAEARSTIGSSWTQQTMCAWLSRTRIDT
jgi:hypothetical protein